MIPPLKNNFRGLPGERIPHQWLNTIANFWNQLTVDGGGLSRWSDGHYTTITASGRTPDADGYNGTLVPPGRKTIDANPEDGTHKYELQLQNVENVGTYGWLVPFFKSEAGAVDGGTPQGTCVTGELVWARIDSKSNTAGGGYIPYSSIDVEDSTGAADGVLSVYGFQGAARYTVPYKDETGGTPSGKYLNWQWPAVWNSDPNPQANSGIFLSTPVGTAAPATPNVTIAFSTGTIAVAEGRVAFTHPGSTITAFGTVDMGTWLPTIPEGSLKHNELGWVIGNYFRDNFGATCFDHDPRHWIKGDDENDNYGQAIGKADKTKVISLDGRELYGTLWIAEHTFRAEILQADTELDVGGDKVVGASASVGTYTSPSLGAVWFGLPTGEPGYPYAHESDLESLRTAFETVRDSHNAIRTALINHGLIKV